MKETAVTVRRDTDLITENIQSLSRLITEAVDHHVEVAPIYRSIANKVLEVLNNENEIANLEPKDLIRLVDVVNKAQLVPVEQLTKLVQAASALYEQNQLSEKLAKVDKLITKIEEESIINYEDPTTKNEDVSNSFNLEDLV